MRLASPLRSGAAALALALAALTTSVPARATDLAAAAPAEIPQSVLDAPGFLGNHPDVRWQLEGLKRARRGSHAQALEAFEQAARHADKFSQAMLATMHWHGQGTSADRATGYAWMDLAAERGYRPLLLERERMWAALSEQEQQRAIEVGQRLYAEYGDEVAKPRLERSLRAGLRRSVTGSRTGYDSGVKLVQPGADGSLGASAGSARVDGFDVRWWQPDRYWALQDERWGKAPVAEIEVLPLQPDPGRGD